jgi:GNAT superfamily N-acetyltransferase
MALGTQSSPGPHDRPHPDGSDVRRMRPDEVGEVARALADAFYDDPIVRWMAPADDRRRARMERSFAFYLERIWLQHEECWTHAGYAGAALWLPPGTWHLPAVAQLRLLPGLVRRLRGDALRLLRITTVMERNHPQEPHYYLPIVGVRSGWQGRGFGAALLRPVLERCDAERVPAYLEASSERSRALYARQGFVDRGEVLRAGDSPPLWPMWREPMA